MKLATGSVAIAAAGRQLGAVAEAIAVVVTRATAVIGRGSPRLMAATVRH